METETVNELNEITGTQVAILIAVGTIVGGVIGGVVWVRGMRQVKKMDEETARVKNS